MLNQSKYSIINNCIVLCGPAIDCTKHTAHCQPESRTSCGVTLHCFVGPRGTTRLPVINNQQGLSLEATNCPGHSCQSAYDSKHSHVSSPLLHHTEVCASPHHSCAQEYVQLVQREDSGECGASMAVGFTWNNPY